MTLDSASVDIYDALSEDFILQDATGTVSLVIPANEAILVDVCPANGGNVSFDKNKMLVDGVVVDYNQSTQPFSWAPRIKALAAADNPFQAGLNTTLYCTVSDADSDQFTYQWSATAGSISGTGAQVNFTVPAAIPGRREHRSASSPTRRATADTASLQWCCPLWKRSMTLRKF